MKTCMFIFISILVIFQLSCKDEIQNPKEEIEKVDAKTIATPQGGILPSAEDGPVRSVKGQPNVDLDTYKLSLNGLVTSPFDLSWQAIKQWQSVYSDTMLMYCVEG